MNKRIQELVEQAVVATEQELYRLSQSTDGMPSYKDVFNQKFAELIVRECADIADEMEAIGCAYPGDAIVESMGLGTEEGAATWRTK